MASEKVFTRKIIRLPNAVPSGVPYSPAVVVDNTMYISGQVGVDPTTHKLVPGGIGPETEQAATGGQTSVLVAQMLLDQRAEGYKHALTNIGGLLKVAGIDYNNVVKVTVLLSDINDWPAMNTIYEKFFKSHYPARAAYAVKNLPLGAKVEIEAVAVVGKIVDQE